MSCDLAGDFSIYILSYLVSLVKSFEAKLLHKEINGRMLLYRGMHVNEIFDKHVMKIKIILKVAYTMGRHTQVFVRTYRLHYC